MPPERHERQLGPTATPDPERIARRKGLWATGFTRRWRWLWFVVLALLLAALVWGFLL